MPRTIRQPVVAGASASRTVLTALDPAPMHRVVEILGALQRGQKFTAPTFAKQFGVTTTTIKRTLDLMRDRLGVAWDWDAVRGTYHLTRPCETLPLLRIEPREALALALAARMFARSYGPAFGRILSDLLKKVAPLFGGEVSLAAEAVDQIVSRPAAAAERELDHFFPLFDAIRERRVLRLDYGKPSSPGLEQRQVHPLHLAEEKHRWELVAYDPSRGAVRHFLLKRIRKLSSTAATFEPPADFDLRKHLRGRMGSFAGDKEQEVRIALDAQAASYAREEPWHESQQLTQRVDGRTELTLRVTHLAGVRNTVQQWGRHAEVLAPEELRAEVRADLKAAAAQYGT